MKDSNDKIVSIRFKKHEYELIELLRKKLSNDTNLDLNITDVIKIAIKDLIKNQ